MLRLLVCRRLAVAGGSVHYSGSATVSRQRVRRSLGVDLQRRDYDMLGNLIEQGGEMETSEMAHILKLASGDQQRCFSKSPLHPAEGLLLLVKMVCQQRHDGAAAADAASCLLGVSRLHRHLCDRGVAVELPAALLERLVQRVLDKRGELKPFDVCRVFYALDTSPALFPVDAAGLDLLAGSLANEPIEEVRDVISLMDACVHIGYTPPAAVLTLLAETAGRLAPLFSNVDFPCFYSLANRLKMRIPPDSNRRLLDEAQLFVSTFDRRSIVTLFFSFFHMGVKLRRFQYAAFVARVRDIVHDFTVTELLTVVIALAEMNHPTCHNATKAIIEHAAPHIHQLTAAQQGRFIVALQKLAPTQVKL